MTTDLYPDEGNAPEQPRGYSALVRIIHWSMAILMIVMLGAGIWMVQGDWGGEYPPLRGQLYDIHRGIGFILMILAVVRLLAYRFTDPPSPLPPSVSPGQRRAAHMVHFLLYMAFIIQPLLGWYATNAWGVANISVFGWFDLPTIAAQDRDLGNQLLVIHGYIGFFITGLVVLHILGVAYHAFIARDGVASRMVNG